MRKVTVIVSVVMLVLSLMITGTIMAQGRGGPGTGAATAWLGISFAETDGGVAVTRVADGSPAATGGLLAGDVIVSVDDQAIESGHALTEIVRAHQPGDIISITVTRESSTLTLEVELGSPTGPGHDEIGADTDPLAAAERVLHVDLAETDEGYQVVAGRMRPEDTLAVDDIITAVNGTAIAEVDWPALLTELAGQDSPSLTLAVLRGGEETTVTLDPFGGPHGREPFDDSGRPGHGSTGGQGSDQSQGETAPHPVDPGATCDQCHSGSQNARPVVPDNTSTDSTSA